MIGVEWELNATLTEPRPLEGCGRNTLSVLASNDAACSAVQQFIGASCSQLLLWYLDLS